MQQFVSHDKTALCLVQTSRRIDEDFSGFGVYGGHGNVQPVANGRVFNDFKGGCQCPQQGIAAHIPIPQYNQLQEASNLAKVSESPATVRVEQGAATLKFALPRQGVSLVVVEW
jgi:hypothetical protein